MTRIDAKYLTKVYKNGEYALKNCSFTVKGGEFLVIVGASGAGKSTLLKVLAGTEKLSSGELYFDGILSDNIPVSKRSVSMAFQEYLLYPHMTVFDNLATPLKLAGEDEKSIYDRVMGALDVFNLSVCADVKPKNLSGGEQQRVALAKALLKRSKLVLLDEPMSNVDEKSRWDYCLTLKKMKQLLPDSTFIYVTHNAKEAFYLADRIAVMDDGAFLQIAPKDFLSRHFEHLSSMQVLGVAGNISELEYDGESALEEETFGAEIPDLDYSKISAGQRIVAVSNVMHDERVHLFDEDGHLLSISSTELRLPGCLEGNKLSFANQTVELGDSYMSRLLRDCKKVDVLLSVDKFSKTVLSGGFSLVFEVMKNEGDFVVLKTQERSFIYSKKTDLKVGEKIRLYYRTNDLLLYDGDERLTCHYSLHRKIEIRVIDPKNGVIELLGRRIRLNKPVPGGTRHVRITQDGFKLSYEKGKCAIPVLGCLDEEFINGKKLNHLEIKGSSGYLSFISEENVTCFGKNKVWLNIISSNLKF